MTKLLLRLAFRNLERQKFYTLINLSGLALGLLAFFVISFHVFYEKSFDRFHKKADRIYRLTSATKERVAAIVPYTWGQAMKEEISAIENVVSFQNITIALTVKKGDHVYAQHGFIGVDSTFLDIFDFPVLSGNKEEFLRSPNKMLITPEMADKYFMGENPIGKTLQVNLWGTFVIYEVEGIINCPKNSHIQFNFLIPIHLVKKHIFDPLAFDSWTIHFAHTYFLMAERFDQTKIHGELKAFLERHGGKKLSDKYTPSIQALNDIYLKSDIRFDFPPRGNNQHLLILLLVAFGILIMAVINFINISSAQSLGRVKEICLKKILGAKKGLLFIQFIIESTAITLVSMLLAILLLPLLLPIFNDFTGTTFAWSELQTASNFLYALGISLAVGILSGTYPALILSSFDSASILSSRSGGQLKRALARKILVAVQFSLAVLLLISTGIIHDQVQYMREKDLGINKEQVIVLSSARNVASDPQKMELFREELIKHEGIEMISASSSFPGDPAHWSSRYLPDGMSEDESVSLWTIYTDHDFVSVYDLALVQGRNFDRDHRSDTSVILINEAAVKQFANSDPSWLTDPLNKFLEYKEGKKAKVIGILKDFHFESLKEQLNPLVIQMGIENAFSIQIKLNTEDIAETIRIIETSWKKLFPEIPFGYSFLDQKLALHFESDQKLGRLMQIFTILSIVIAALGLFGLATFLAFQKAHEMSIRKIMGASEKQLTILLTWDFLKLIVIANLIAIPVGYLLLSKWLEAFAFRTQLSVSVFLMAAGFSLLIALLTIGRQAYKTATVNPVDVLSRE